MRYCLTDCQTTTVLSISRSRSREGNRCSSGASSLWQSLLKLLCTAQPRRRRGSLGTFHLLVHVWLFILVLSPYRARVNNAAWSWLCCCWHICRQTACVASRHRHWWWNSYCDVDIDCCIPWYLHHNSFSWLHLSAVLVLLLERRLNVCICLVTGSL